MKILIIDNYDSFTFNLYQNCGEIFMKKDEQFVLDVKRNDAITISEIKGKKYDKILISPGPGDPRDHKYFGICTEVIMKLGKTVPVLGICLGMQGIAACFGGNVVRAKKPMHGKSSAISHDGKRIFISLPQDLEVMRYHSLIVEKDSLPECLEITSVAKDTNEIMGLRHKIYPIEGIQFHPESFATEGGKRMLENFLYTKYE
jgi:anthranilate synthase/aminodeoxychorismate synthase-like glutamine amidotransferase